MSQDNVPKDLETLFENSRTPFMNIDEEKLMQSLVIYIVNRDHKILNHGIELGKKNENSNQINSQAL